MSQPMIGPLPYPPLPAQPSFLSWCTAWAAYDVPRMWDTVRLENDRLGWEQSVGFRALAELLVDHYRRLRTQHSQLLNAWQSPAAMELLARVDSFSTALLSDAHCAQTTAQALDGIMQTYADAQVRMGALSRHWDSVTTDWVPEWWDAAAEELNEEARTVMKSTDDAVADLRTKIIIPRGHGGGFDSTSGGLSPTGPGTHTGAQTPKDHAFPAIPSVPGYEPVTTSGSSQTGAAPLSSSSGSHEGSASPGGGPRFIPAAPGQPVSMLPIPPGSQHAPFGGAYVLRGPGVGKGGYVVQMPRSGMPTNGPTRGSSPFAPPAQIRPTGGSTSGGLMPFSLGSLPTSNQSSSSSNAKRPPDTVWEIRTGVPPVIEPVAQDAFIPDHPSANQEEAFKDWFAELAYPWRAQSSRDAQEPHVLLRRAKE